MAQNVNKNTQAKKARSKSSKPKTGVTIIVFTPEQKSKSSKVSKKSNPVKPVSKKGKTK
jgi:hypothetical protein